MHNVFGASNSNFHNASLCCTATMCTCNQWERPLKLSFGPNYALYCWLWWPVCLITVHIHYQRVLCCLDANGSCTTLWVEVFTPAALSLPPVRRKRPWCTTPSTWWPPPLNAPPRSPSAPSSATDTNPGASDHASWTCSKTWVRCSGFYSRSSIHHIHLYHCLPPRQFLWAAGAETEELVNQITRVLVMVAVHLMVPLKRQFTRDTERVSCGLDKYSPVQLQGNRMVNMGPVKWDFATFAKT